MKNIFSEKHKPGVIVICGPTGIGKTGAAIEAARFLGGEIINADSMQIYRHMDIGTAKPTPAEKAAAPHHLVDIAEPDDPFDAAMFSDRARRIADDLIRMGKPPVLAGGTGLYIKAFLYGIFESPAYDPAIREKLKQEAESAGSPVLHERLCKIDPETAERLHPNDAYRIIRALEHYASTGRPISEFHQSHQFADTPYRPFKIGLEMERPRLYERIERRVDAMIEAGLLEEVRTLLRKGCSPDLKSMQSIGYRHMTEYILGKTGWDEAVRTLKRDTRRFAKRQFTWFRADTDIRWTAPENIRLLFPEIRKFLRGE